MLHVSSQFPSVEDTDGSVLEAHVTLCYPGALSLEEGVDRRRTSAPDGRMFVSP